jgi:hypothetical protein
VGPDARHLAPYPRYRNFEVMGLKRGSLATFFFTLYFYSANQTKVMEPTK